MLILGVDPGTNTMGYTVGKYQHAKFELLAFGALQLGQTNLDFLGKMKRIFDRINSIIIEYHPEALAIESPFVGKNAQSALKLGRAQGMVIAAAQYHEIEVYEYAPRKIKKSITGMGGASKEQVAAMLLHLIPQLAQHQDYVLDATDSLAVAYCHCLQSSTPQGKTKYKDWSTFVSNNPDRL